MTESDLYKLVIATLEAGLAAFAFTGVTVKQSYQPRTVGTPTTPTVLLSNQPLKRYGFARIEDKWDDTVDPGVMRHTETQAMECTIQVNALVHIDPPPHAPPPYTAGDLLLRCSSILQSSAGLAQLRAGGCGMERITEIRRPYFSDDQVQFEASPSFDFVLVFNQIDITETPIITAEEFKVVAV